MSSVRFEMRMPRELHERVEAARGDVPRARFVVRALEAALNRSPVYPAPADADLSPAVVTIPTRICQSCRTLFVGSPTMTRCQCGGKILPEPE